MGPGGGLPGRDKLSENQPSPLNRLMADARAMKFNCVLVWKLDRFGRSLVDCLNNIRVLEDYGIRFIAVTQGSTPTSGTRRADFCCTFSGRLRNSKGP